MNPDNGLHLIFRFSEGGKILDMNKIAENFLNFQRYDVFFIYTIRGIKPRIIQYHQPFLATLPEFCHDYTKSGEVANLLFLINVIKTRKAVVLDSLFVKM